MNRLAIASLASQRLEQLLELLAAATDFLDNCPGCRGAGGHVERFACFGMTTFMQADGMPRVQKVPCGSATQRIPCTTCADFRKQIAIARKAT